MVWAGGEVFNFTHLSFSLKPIDPSTQRKLLELETRKRSPGEIAAAKEEVIEPVEVEDAAVQGSNKLEEPQYAVIEGRRYRLRY